MIEIKGKIYRNIQEQVAKNQEDIDDLNHRMPIADQFYTKEESDALYQTKEAMSNYFTKTQSNDKFLEKDALTDYSIDHIIMGNSEIDNDTVELRAVYSQDVKSEVSLDPNSIIIRTMSGTDVSTLGISATEVDITTPMLKYGTSEVATKTDVNAKQDTLISGTTIKTINNVSLLGSGNIDIASANHLYQIEVSNVQSNVLYRGVFLVASANNLNSGNYNRTQLFDSFGYNMLRGSGSAMNTNNEIIRVSPNLEISTADITLIFIYYDNVEQDWQDDTIILDSVFVRKIY